MVFGGTIQLTVLRTMKLGYNEELGTSKICSL
jgi:hypothetical protein